MIWSNFFVWTNANQPLFVSWSILLHVPTLKYDPGVRGIGECDLSHCGGCTRRSTISCFRSFGCMTGMAHKRHWIRDEFIKNSLIQESYWWNIQSCSPRVQRKKLLSMLKIWWRRLDVWALILSIYWTWECSIFLFDMLQRSLKVACYFQALSQCQGLE